MNITLSVFLWGALMATVTYLYTSSLEATIWMGIGCVSYMIWSVGYHITSKIRSGE